MQARIEDGVVIVLAPATLGAHEERQAVESLVRRVVAKRASTRNDDDLMRRALVLSRRYVPGAPTPSSVRWVSNMTTRWASCSTGDASIRLSDKLIGMPAYVIDAVLLHEVAHLAEPGHGERFRAIVRADPKHDLAEAYLAGASFAAHRGAEALPAVGGPDCVVGAHTLEAGGDEADSNDLHP